MCIIWVYLILEKMSLEKKITVGLAYAGNCHHKIFAPHYKKTKMVPCVGSKYNVNDIQIITIHNKLSAIYIFNVCNGI